MMCCDGPVTRDLREELTEVLTTSFTDASDPFARIVSQVPPSMMTTLTLVAPASRVAY